MFNITNKNGPPAEAIPAATNIDAYALFTALTGKTIDRDGLASTSSRTVSEDYDDLRDLKSEPSLGREPQADQRPKDGDINIGAANPWALVEHLLGHRLDHNSQSSARILSDVLQTDYDELFDMKHDSVLYAGLRLNDGRAEELREQDVKILEERDLVTPDLSRVRKLNDLERVGLKNLGDTRVKVARMQNGKLRIVIDGGDVARTVSNRDVTRSVNDVVTRYRRDKGQWTPPNSSWRDINEVVSQQMPQRMISDMNRFHYDNQYNNINLHNNHINRFDDPVQGATSNSWLIAAIFSVFWANPSDINRVSHAHNNRDHDNNGRGLTYLGTYDSSDDRRDGNRRFSVRFHDKGGRNNSETRNVEVDYEVPINKSSNNPVYARASGEADIWPALYEKAFAKWMTRTTSERPDITQTAHGDPIKAMSQINGREPHYYFTAKHDANDLVSVVRSQSVNFKAINPMAAFTHASGSAFRGANLVANHAYSVLGWTEQGDRQYIIVRNPWGVTEPRGLTAYPGLLDRVEPELWRPASLVDREGVMAIEAQSFQEYFAALGVAK